METACFSGGFSVHYIHLLLVVEILEVFLDIVEVIGGIMLH